MSCSGGNTATTGISNESSVEIKSLIVGVSGQERSIINLHNGENIYLIFHDLHDSHYVLDGELVDGSNIHGEFGYVTNGMDFRDLFVIHENGKVEFKPGAH